MNRLLTLLIIATAALSRGGPTGNGVDEIIYSGAAKSEDLQVDFIIAVSAPQGTGFGWTVTGRFSNATWNRLWKDLRVPREDWEAWQNASGSFPILPELPTVSRLAYIDEGTTSFNPVLLSYECETALTMASDPDVREMLADLQRASARASGPGATVDIYPSVGESIGEQFSSRLDGSE